VRVEEHAATELLAVRSADPPPVHPVLGTAVVVADRHRERPALRVLLFAFHGDDVGLAR